MKIFEPIKPALLPVTSTIRHDMRQKLILSILVLFFPYIIHASLDQRQCDQFISNGKNEWSKSINCIDQANSANPEKKQKIIDLIEQAIRHCDSAIAWFDKVRSAFTENELNNGWRPVYKQNCEQNIIFCKNRIDDLSSSLTYLKWEQDVDLIIATEMPTLNEMVADVQVKFNKSGKSPGGFSIDLLNEAQITLAKIINAYEKLLQDISKIGDPLFQLKHQNLCDQIITAVDFYKQNLAELITEIPSLEIRKTQGERVVSLYDQAANLGKQAQSIIQENAYPSHLRDFDSAVLKTREASQVFIEAESACREALELAISSKLNKDADVIQSAVDFYHSLAEKSSIDADSLASKKEIQLAAIQATIEQIRNDLSLYEERGMVREYREDEKRLLPLLAELYDFEGGDQTEIEQLRLRISQYEIDADDKRLTPVQEFLSFDEYLEREMYRINQFYAGQVARPFECEQESNADAEESSVLTQNALSPTVISLDQNPRFCASLHLDKFYTYYVVAGNSFTNLTVDVFHDEEKVHSKNIPLPVYGTDSWCRYLLESLQVLIPETELRSEYGLELRISLFPHNDGKYSILISHCGHDERYRFALNLDEDLLYSFSLKASLPWQMESLNKPRLPCILLPFPSTNATIDIQIENDSSPDGVELAQHDALDAFVKELNNDPFAIAQYVQNEIGYADPFMHFKDSTLLAPPILRTACGVYFDQQGSPWEQCALLIYMLRKAGFEAHYLDFDPYQMPIDYMENLLKMELSLPDEIYVNFPGVAFKHGDQWIPLFPWMKECAVSYGHDLYNFLPDAYASAERWIHRYLQNDPEIMKHIGPDGDDTAGILFVRFLDENLKLKGLSLDDVGFQHTQLRRQYSSWEEFPRPENYGQFRVPKTLSNQPRRYASLNINIYSKENPSKLIQNAATVAQLSLKPVEISFEPNEGGHQLKAKFKAQGLSWGQQLDSSDLNIIVNVELTAFCVEDDNYLFYNSRSFTMSKGSRSVLCFQPGLSTTIVTNHFREIFTRTEDSSTKLNALLSFIAYYYFQKCSDAEVKLTRLHALSSHRILGFGLAKLAPEISIGPLKGEPELKYPQVDMHSISMNDSELFEVVSCNQFILANAYKLRLLLNVDWSSNEHQVLKEVFNDPYAVSTSKLLQLSHQVHVKSGRSGSGFIQLDSTGFTESLNMPEVAQCTTFAYLPDLKLRKLIAQSCGVWDEAKMVFESKMPYNILNGNALAYAYITPDITSSLNSALKSDCSYLGIGAFLFGPHIFSAIITDNGQLINGGRLPQPPESLVTGNSFLDWCFMPFDRGFSLKDNFQSSPAPQNNDNIFDHYPDYVVDYYMTEFNKSTFDFDGTVYASQEKDSLHIYFSGFGNENYYHLNGVNDWRPEVRQEHKSMWQTVADPVDVVTGGFYIDEVDLSLPGPFNFTLRRNYSSLNTGSSVCGNGWKLSLNPALKVEGDKIYAAEQDGTVIVYTFEPAKDRWIVKSEDNPDLGNDNSGGKGGMANPFHAFIENDNGYVLHGSDGSLRRYEGLSLKTWTDAAGNVLTFIYEDTELVRIESSRGAYLTMNYNPLGKLSSVYSSDNRRVHYNYNMQNDLTLVVLPNGAEISYDYDHFHRIIRETKPHGQVIENVYDTEGRVVEQRTPSGQHQAMVPTAKFKYEEGTTTIEDALGNCTLYKHYNGLIYKITDPCGNMILQSWYIDRISWFDPMSESVVQDEVPSGWQHSLKEVKDQRGLITKYSYDPRGNVILLSMLGKDIGGVGVDGIEKSYEYNDRNLLEKETWGNRETITTYDERFPLFPSNISTYYDGALISYCNYAYDSQGQVESVDQSGSKVTWSYDALGYPYMHTQLTDTDDTDVVTTYRFNDHGQCISSTTMDAVYTNQYDIMGNKLVSKVHSLQGVLISAEYRGYNLHNRPMWIQSEDPMQLLKIDYAASGKIKQLRNELSYAKLEFSPDGVPSFKGLETGGTASTIFEYDYFGNVLREVDALGQWTFRDYDQMGRMICERRGDYRKEFEYEPGGKVKEVKLPNGARILRTYSVVGQLLSEIYPDGTEKLINYDQYGRVVYEKSQGVAWVTKYIDAERKVVKTHLESGTEEVSEYDMRGNLIKQTDPEGYVVELRYDGLNRKIEEIAADGTITLWNYIGDEVICRLPNGEKAVETFVDGKVIENKLYNASDELIIHNRSKFDPLTNSREDWSGEKLTKTWMNTQGLPVAIQEEDKLNIVHYDVLGQGVVCIDGLGRITRTEFDIHGRLKEKTLDDGTQYHFKYDQGSNLTGFDLPGGSEWVASYDLMGRKLTEQLVVGKDSTNKHEFKYSEGRLVESVDPTGSSHLYQYDSLGRVFSEEIGSVRRTYDYDKNNLVVLAKRVDQHDTEVKRSYDSMGRIIGETVSCDGEVLQNTVQSWTTNGRTLEIGDHLRKFNYEGGRLSSVSTDGFTTAYKYDRGGLEIAKTTPCQHIATEYSYKSYPRAVSSTILDKKYNEVLDWDKSGKLSTYSCDFPNSSKSNTYKYNGRGALVRVNEQHFESDFGGTGAGILTQTPDLTISKEGLDAFGRAIAEKRGGVGVESEYDQAGCMFKRRSRNVEEELKWDNWGRLIEIKSAQAIWNAVYDPLGRRIKTEYTPSEGEQIIQYACFDPEVEFQEIGARCGDKTYWKIYSHRACEAVIDESGHIAELVHDTLGNLMGVISENAISWSESMPSPYGVLDSVNDGKYDTVTHFAKTMAWRSLAPDPTGLIWMGARYYDPKGGRFISTDPVGYPLSANLYSYANGDPISYHDPNGRYCTEVYMPVENAFFHGPLKFNDPLSNGLKLLGNIGLVPSNFFQKEATAHQVGVFSWSQNYFTYANGIDTNLARGIEGAEKLSEYLRGHQIELIHNPTNGQVIDIGNWAVFSKMNIDCEYVRFIRSRWDHAFSQINDNGLIIHTCHSAGVAYTKLALMKYPEELRKRIVVIALCPAAYIEEELCGSIQHFCSKGDFVHLLACEGFYPGKKNVTFLDPHKDAPWFDHDVTSPTLSQAITKETRKYLQ